MTRIAFALPLGLAAIGTLAVAGPASPLGPPPPAGTGLARDRCIVDRDLGNHAVVDQNTLLWNAVGRSGGTYRVTMRNGCLRSAVSSDPIEVRQVGGGRICAPRDVRIVARGGLCDIASIVKLTPEEAAAVPRRLRP
ncbi:hypothetical protein [Phenylobacterium sp.]|uniref:hypothetical protein n=1 Tax=Phenylobacterium sp. TaxID=1871053 RepID=UPI0025E04E01|nr:hypothetical protein [Phenylobacterium sp.]MBX3483436.1 hypothetical protein [Phenylobacterium sp.]MCW5760725.1 hypothetical protein [Phenylobacterium sp.]